MIRRILAATGVLLGLFHAWLFIDQAWDGRLADPAVLSRWIVAAGLTWLLLRAWRGTGHLGRRKAVAIWLLAALLHAPAAAKRLDSPLDLAVPDIVVTLAKVSLATGLAALIGLLGLRRRRTDHLTDNLAGLIHHAWASPLSVGAYRSWAARPPPLT